MNYKKFCLAFLLSLILINTGLVMPSYANERELRTITVTGEGIENIATSQAIVRLGVEVQGKEAGKVQRETATRSDAVVKFLRSRQVEKLETTGISLQPNYDFSNNQRRLIGYIGANLISFQIDIAQAGSLIDEAVKVGATRIDGVSFTAGESAIAAAQRTALIKATEQAREQATIVLQALGLVPKETVSIQVGNTSNPDFLRTWNAEESAAEVAESAGKMLYADYVESGSYPIVMANEFGGVIFHEACGHLLETTQIEQKTTPFLDKKGEKIAHENLTAWDEGLSDKAFGTIDMDDEGMPAQRTLLIENGILKNFIADRTGSIKTGHPRTGSGRRQNYTYAAASRMRNTYIAPGEYTLDNLFNSIDKGIYCKKMGGGSVGATGEFNFAVEEAYLIENGNLTKPLKGATLIGSAKEIMNKISMCSQDLGLAAGFCGSVSGSVYVTVGQPHLKVDSITVGGR